MSQLQPRLASGPLAVSARITMMNQHCVLIKVAALGLLSAVGQTSDADGARGGETWLSMDVSLLSLSLI